MNSRTKLFSIKYEDNFFRELELKLLAVLAFSLIFVENILFTEMVNSGKKIPPNYYDKYLSVTKRQFLRIVT